jgi:hypothetical protein
MTLEPRTTVDETRTLEGGVTVAKLCHNCVTRSRCCAKSRLGSALMPLGVCQ